MPEDVTQPVGEDAKENLAAAGEELAGAVGDGIDGSELSDAAEELAGQLSELTPVAHADLDPALESAYKDLAGVGDDIVSHLVAADFFGAVDDTLPPFDPDFLEACLVHGLQSVGEASVFETAGVEADLSGYISNCVAASEEIEREVRWEPDKPEKVSPMTTRGATEGVVDWLDDLGRHRWMSEELLSEEMLDDASTHTDAFGSALLLIAEGAAGLGDDSSDPEDAVAQVVGGIALHTYHQRRLPEDLSWITDDMRAPGAWAAD